MNEKFDSFVEEISQFDSAEFNLDCFDPDGNFIDETDNGGTYRRVTKK